MKRIILIDGNNILYRSYYATAYTGNIMRNSKGFPTNALFGYINTLNKIIEEEKPSHVLVAFDKGKTFRHDKYEAYKEGRAETPDDLILQFPLAKEITEAMGLNYLDCDNYEADDIIGSFAKRVEETEDTKALIISSDKDLLQLLSKKVKIKLLKQKDSLLMDSDDFEKEYGIKAENMIDLKALMGDASDNIPGVKGIGEKTALKLLHEYKNLDGVYENIESIKGKVKDKLIAEKAEAYLSYELATICQKAPIDIDFDKIKYRAYDPLKFISILEELEFNSLIKRLNIGQDKIRQDSKLKAEVIKDMKDLKINSDFSIYPEILGYDYHQDELISLTLYDSKKVYYIEKEVFLKDPSILLSDYKKYTYDAKRLIYLLKREALEIKNIVSDLMIAAFLLNYIVKDDIAYLMHNLGTKVEFYDSLFGTKNKLQMPDEALLINEQIKKAKFIYDERKDLENALKEDGQFEVYQNLELPLVFVLAKMEFVGIKVDSNILEKQGEEISKKLEIISSQIYTIAKKEFNIASPKQLSEVLFKDLEIPYPMKIKGDNYSTAASILSKVKDLHPIIPLVERYRLLSKIYGTYVSGLKSEIVDGRIHTTFNQNLTRTGRLSSSNPNLQNIPIRTKEGRKIRKAFLSDDNSILMASDYSQIELRVFAHMSKAPNLVEAFQDGEDIHTRTAMEIFKVSKDEVNSNMRREAKAVNFGILYGISAFGLSEDLGINISLAKNFIDQYLKTFPGIKDFMEKLIEEAKEKLSVRTLMNRKRVINELNDRNYMVRSNGERMALNTPIQGSSAEIIKKAMIEIDEALEKNNFKSQLLLQVHDELVLNVLKEEEEQVTNLVQKIMENTYQLIVPLQVDIKKGKDWFEAS